MGSHIAFLVVSALVLIAAWRVVATDDVMRAGLALVLVLGGMAPLFILLAADFLAAVQVLVYVGAVVVLLLFAIMLTRSPGTREAPSDRRSRQKVTRVLSGFLACSLVAVVVGSATSAFGDARIDPQMPISLTSLGSDLLRSQLLAFEAISVLLLVALIGAIVIARREP